MDYSLSKSERLNKKSLIDSLFGRQCPALISHGFRFSYQLLDGPQAAWCAVVFISSKKKLKKAVERNKRKRILREFYRLNKNELLDFLEESQIPIALSINYVGAESLIFHKHQIDFRKAIKKLINELKKNPKFSVHLAN